MAFPYFVCLVGVGYGFKYKLSHTSENVSLAARWFEGRWSGVGEG